MIALVLQGAKMLEGSRVGEREKIGFGVRIL